MAQLLQYLGRGAFGHPAHSGEIPAVSGGPGHKGKAQGQKTQRQGRDLPVEPDVGDRLCAQKEQTGGQQAPYEAVKKTAEYGPAGSLGGGAGQLLGDQASGGQTHPGQRQGDTEGIDGQQELIDAHPFRTDLVGDVYQKSHAQSAQEQGCGGENQGVEQKFPSLFHGG